jgi:uncharacterized protein (TIGR02594 family)
MLTYLLSKLFGRPVQRTVFKETKETAVMIQTSAFLMAQRFIGIKELPGDKDNPFVMSMLTLDNSWPEHDEVPWCSAFANYICWLLRLPRSKSLAARSWLQIGSAIALESASPGFDVVILKRGDGVQPGPEVIDAPGHVGFFAGLEGGRVNLLAGNQSNQVNVTSFPVSQVLGVRRLSA